MSEYIGEYFTEQVKLEAIITKARIAAHDFAKSFLDHPNHCVYCAPTQEKTV